MSANAAFSLAENSFCELRSSSRVSLSCELSCLSRCKALKPEKKNLHCMWKNYHEIWVVKLHWRSFTRSYLQSWIFQLRLWFEVPLLWPCTCSWSPDAVLFPHLVPVWARKTWLVHVPVRTELPCNVLARSLVHFSSTTNKQWKLESFGRSKNKPWRWLENKNTTNWIYTQITLVLLDERKQRKFSKT